MSQDDDDIGGGTLVMNPEDRPPLPAAGQPTPGAFATDQAESVDDSWDDDATDNPGTFIMNVDHHAQTSNPASPFAETSKERGAWPAAPPVGQVVVGPAAAAPDPKLAHARTLMGPSMLTPEAEALIQQNLAAQAATAPPAPPAFGPPPQIDAAAIAAPREPSYPQIEPRVMPSFPTVDSSGPVPFPPPGAYPTEQALRAAQSGGGLKPLMLGAAVGLATVTVVVGGFYAYRALTVPSAPVAASASASGAAPTPAGSGAKITPPAASAKAPLGSASAAPAASTSAPNPDTPPASGAEAAARQALEKFADGLKKCVAQTIHVLPGTSPPVPTAMAFLKGGSYRPGINDFNNAVYNCAGFKLTTPMPFVLQWQGDGNQGKKGAAIAWLDDDGDGKADRAFGFEAKLAKRNVAEIGPIEAMDPKRPIKKR